MDIVSFETAKRLKEAGFPQPEPEVGQYWAVQLASIGRWDSSVGGCVRLIVPSSVEDDDPSFDIRRHFYLDVQKNRYSSGMDYFAPTATDILRELPFGRGIHFDAGLFSVRVLRLNDSELIVDSVHENPAEACAAAYLGAKLHQQ